MTLIETARQLQRIRNEVGVLNEHQKREFRDNVFAGRHYYDMTQDLVRSADHTLQCLYAVIGAQAAVDAK